ncbi:MAG: bifunctional aldolase/short-chain dehydrogenase [Gammaproteobacteria bacterium]|nr:bifunctional aldolase/short-chain dehydrogenase [Gammaproteobacteria bacterium]MDH5651732.1 bifunctional aldolase/short-chain dehydrogenase [Gammaproteobacteria bacterium]
MKSLWDEKEAGRFTDDLDLRVYSSQLLGRDTSLVLHGGGNTSVKITENNILGEAETILYVKGSGWDLETIERPGYAPVRMDHLLKLAELEQLSDLQMVNELRTHMTLASAPTPSVEAILHAVLPYKYVDHTHADAVVTVTNTPNGLLHIKDIYGDRVVIIPYCMPGFDLARLCAKEFAAQRHAGTEGMVLMNHGIFSFGETAKESYERMIKLVDMAEQYLDKNKAWTLLHSGSELEGEKKIYKELAVLRAEVSTAAGKAVLLKTNSALKYIDFVQRDDIADIALQGPATPDHVIRTKRIPMLGRDVDGFVAGYKRYFNKYAPNARQEVTMLDPAPRVILDHEFGLVSVGVTAKDTRVIEDIYDHTIDIILRAARLESYRALPGQDIFDVEYWELEQAKLRKSGSVPMFSGEVALVTGAASGIGKACVASFLARGAAVIGLDIDSAVTSTFQSPAYLGLVCDVSITQHIIQALEQGVRRFGGLDMLVLNAGIFPAGVPIRELKMETWREVMQINLDACLLFMREAYPLLKLAPNGGRVVLMGSKNVPAPGPGAAAYSVSKAGLTQLMRVAALEWGPDNIRVNCLHPDAVFDTGIWTDDIIKSRAESYGMSVEDYKRKNLLKTDITSHDVAELAAEMCGPLFAKTTAAQLPVDGGNDRVI